MSRDKIEKSGKLPEMFCDIPSGLVYTNDGQGVEVKASTLGQGAGLGLFTTRPVDKNHSLEVEYIGSVVSRFPMTEPAWEDRSHARSISGTSFVLNGHPSHLAQLGTNVELWPGEDGTFAEIPASLCGSLVNDPAKVDVDAKTIRLRRGLCNVKWSQRKRRHRLLPGRQRHAYERSLEKVCLVPTRPLAAGEELLVSYGRGYWLRFISLYLEDDINDWTIAN